MRVKVSNDEIIERFMRIEKLNDKTQEKKIHDQIIHDLSFLVYSNTKRYRKFPNYEDLNQEGFIGLIKATKKFDYKRFPNFFVFANQWIVNGIKRSAKKYDIVYSPKRIKTVYINNEELFANEETNGPDECFYRKERINQVRFTISSLSPRDCTILMNVFGIGVAQNTLRETEKYCGLTYERIRQIKNLIIDKFRSNHNLIEIRD